MSETSGEKSFAPTDKRKRDAAQKGDVLRSRELATAATTLIGGVWLLLAGPWLFERLGEALRSGFTWDRGDLDEFSPGRMLLSALIAGLPPIMVLGVGVLAISLVSQLGFGDGRWIGSNLAPKGSRINPMSGLKRMFGPTGWIEIGKGIAKVALLGVIAWVWGGDRIGAIARLGRGDLSAQASAGWDALVMLVFALSAGLFVIALFDLPVQWVRRMMRLKMTLQELKDENKESEGSPENKAAVRDRQRKIAMGGLIPAMKDAQFVVTNPMHFSVVLSYDPAKAPAPVVLAKGRGDKARAIRELAAEYEVPVLEYPPLARSLFYTTREKQVIREELFVPVAAILGFVMALKRGETRVRPEVSVPVTLRFDTEGRLESATNG